MNKNLIFVFIFFGSTLLSANNDLHQKYLNYRKRLLNEFILVSPNVEQFGTNIPAVDRKLNPDCSVKWLSWSDGNSNFNHWLSILALEYRLLKNNNQDFRETLTMLIYSMLALERLDLYSEYILRKHHNLINDSTPLNLSIKYPEDINGFLLRDDVTLGFWRQYHKHFKSQYGWHINTKDGTNTFLSVFQKGVIPRQGMSQDNIIYLLQALALVKKLVDNENISGIEINYYNNFIPEYLKAKNIISGNMIYFGRWIDDIVERLIKHCYHEYPSPKIVLKPLKGRARPSKNHFGGIMSSSWYIMNPITNDLVAEGNGEDMGVWMNSYGMGEAAKTITGKNYHYDNSDKGLSAYLFKSLLFKKLYIVKTAAVPLPEEIDDYMFRSLASIADININKNSYELLYCLGDKRKKYTYEHNPLVLYILHKNKYEVIYRPGTRIYETDKAFYEYLLTAAPNSYPSTDFTRPDYSPFWSTSSRLNWPNNKGNRNATEVWDFAGMDFMFLYNLYRFVFNPENYKITEDYKYKNITEDYKKYPVPNFKGIDAEFYYMPPKEK